MDNPDYTSIIYSVEDGVAKIIFNLPQYGNALDLNGTTNNYRISVNHNFVRSRAFNVSSGFAITDKTSEIPKLEKSNLIE